MVDTIFYLGAACWFVVGYAVANRIYGPTRFCKTHVVFRKKVKLHPYIRPLCEDESLLALMVLALW
jgi:hypothetical protein